MLYTLEASLGTTGLAMLMLIGTISLLAWWPAIAAVVLSDRSLAHRIPLFVALSIFPPLSIGVMAVSIRKASPARHRAQRQAARRQTTVKASAERASVAPRARRHGAPVCQACV